MKYMITIIFKIITYLILTVMYVIGVICHFIWDFKLYQWDDFLNWVDNIDLSDPDDD